MIPQCVSYFICEMLLCGLRDYLMVFSMRFPLTKALAPLPKTQFYLISISL